MRFINKLLLVVLCVGTASLLSAQGMEFETGNWASILKKAEKENKLIYLDAYTSWCGPCKMMKKSIFPDAQVGTYFNQNFVNAQIDMEKGEGPGLATKYSVNAYPTHLFINGKGELVHLGLGYMDAVQFVDLGKQAIDPKQQYATLRNKYESGDRDAALLSNYLNLLYQMGDESGDKVAQEYFKTQKDLTTDENVKWLNAFAINPSSVNHSTLLANKDVLADKLKTQFLRNLAYSYFMQDAKKGITLEAAQKNISNVYPAKGDILSFYMATFYHKKNKDSKAYDETLFKFLRSGNLDLFDSQELNGYAWYAYESIDDKDRLAQAITWGQASVDKDPQYANMDTLAWLYFKSGDTEKAKGIAKEAIALGNEKGEDTSSTEELLSK